MKKGQGPVFPIILRQVGEDDFRIASIKDQNEGQFLTSSFGMSTRLYLAGMAMQGLLANAPFNTTDIELIADLSLKYSDALIKAEEERR